MFCGDAPTPDPRMAEAALRNAEIAEEALNWYRDIYARDLRPAQDEQRALQRGLIQDYMTDRQQQREFAREQQDYYRQTFKPIEEQVARDAMEYDSDANIARRQGIAGAAVTQAYSSARDQNNRNLSRFGLNPNSGAFAATNARLSNAQALATSGARTGAAFDTIDRGIALRSSVTNLGRNMPNTAANYFALANQTGNAANATGMSGMDMMRQNAAFVGQGFNTGMQGYMNSGNLYGQDFNARMQGYNSQQQALGGLMQGIGGFAGYGMGAGFIPKLFGADGGDVRRNGIGKNVHAGAGKVSGPGGPIDDKVPAMLSAGEYVIPADVVEEKGVKYFDKMVDKHHTPAAEQRRNGLKRKGKK